MPSLFEWSSTASSNTSCDGVNINTGMSPANVDNALRSIMALIRSSFASALQNFLAGSAALPIANGGTGGTTPDSALAALGALADDYRDIVPVSKSSDFTFANSERGGAIVWTGAGGTATLNPVATTPINLGAVFPIHNRGTGSLTISRGSGVTLLKNGSASSANATLAVGATASLVQWYQDHWTITGSGVS